MSANKSTRKSLPKPVDISELPADLKKLVNDYKDEEFNYNPEELKRMLREKKELSKLLPSIRYGRKNKTFALTPNEEDLLKRLITKKENDITFDQEMETDMVRHSLPDSKALNAKKRRNKKIEKKLEEYLKSLQDKKGGRRTKKIRSTRSRKMK
jgi:hypothetical protein